jgi:hypothetical protein
MDDQNFDRLLKEKLDHYEDPSFEQSALDDFHSRMDSWRPTKSFSYRFTHYYLATSILLFTLVNAYLFWPRKNDIQAVKYDNHQLVIDSLANTINQLKKEREILNKQNTIALSSQNDFISPPPNVTDENKIKDKIELGNIQNMNPSLLKILNDAGLIITEDNNVFLLNGGETYNPILLTTSLSNYKYVQLPNIAVPVYKLKTIEVNRSNKHTRKETISAKTRNELEKHYFPGIGLNVAPHFDFYQSIFSSGEGEISPRVGVLADVILTPRWSIETGFDFSTTKLKLEGRQQSVSLPSYDPSLGEIEHVELKNTLISTPVGIKYRQWISPKVQSFLKVGYTPYFAINTKYNLEHDFDHWGSSKSKVNSVQEISSNRFYAGTGTVAFGLTKTLKKKSKIEGAIFYEKSLTPVGPDNYSMQLLGLRTSYWLRIK